MALTTMAMAKLTRVARRRRRLDHRQGHSTLFRLTLRRLATETTTPSGGDSVCRPTFWSPSSVSLMQTAEAY